MLAIKENTNSSPMLFLSRLNNIKNKEVHYVQARTTQQYRCAYLSSTLTPSHESFSHGPLFSGVGKQRKKRWTLPYTILQAILMAYDQSASLKDRFQYARQGLIEMFPIASQKSEGWVCLPDRYDDGGFTGGNMERPAMKRLLGVCPSNN